SRSAISALVAELFARGHLRIEVAPLLRDLRAECLQRRQRPEIELPSGAALAQPRTLRLGRCYVGCSVVGENDAVLFGGGFLGHQAGAHILCDPLRLAIERRTQPSGPSRREHQLVSAADRQILDLRGQILLGPVRPDDVLVRARAETPTANAPGEGVGTVVLEA